MLICGATQYSDQMFCPFCEMTWDTNDPSPPNCQKPRKIEQGDEGMLKANTRQALREWQEQFGGSCKVPSAHALKLLGEAVELCFACGAGDGDVMDTVEYEVSKAWHKGEVTGKYEDRKASEEMADVAICLELLVRGTYVSIDSEVQKKLPILHARKWEPDEAGVLRRPNGSGS